MFLYAYSSDKDGHGKTFVYNGNPVTAYIGIDGSIIDTNKDYMELRGFPAGLAANFPCPLGTFKAMNAISTQHDVRS